jgi:hypothetical protein
MEGAFWDWTEGAHARQHGVFDLGLRPARAGDLRDENGQRQRFKVKKKVPQAHKSGDISWDNYGVDPKMLGFGGIYIPERESVRNLPLQDNLRLGKMRIQTVAVLGDLEVITVPPIDLYWEEVGNE